MKYGKWVKSSLSFLIGIIGFSAQAALDVSGYFDMEYIQQKDKLPYYRQHHLNLLLQHSVANYKFFSEIEFEDALDMDYGRTPVKDDSAKTKQGRLFIERAWAEVTFAPLANIRVGQMLHTSTYYQNHYPSITVNFTDPLTRKKIFDYNIKGSRLWGETNGFYYDVWHGRGPQAADNTTKHESGVDNGAKIAYTHKMDNGSVYLGLMTAKYDQGTAAFENSKANGVELNMNFGSFNLMSEFGKRIDTVASANSIDANFILASYNIDLEKGAELIPFVMRDSLKVENWKKAQTRTAFGLNYRPVPTISYKLEYLASDKYETSTAQVDATNQTSFAFIYFYN